MKEIRAKETRTRVYISGPITGTADYMERFADMEALLNENGYIVYNPAKVSAGMPPETTHEGYMEVSLALLSLCDEIYLMDGWEESVGARMEYAYARGKGMLIVKPEEWCERL